MLPQLKTRAVTLPHHIFSKEDIEAVALRLLRAELPIQVRLMGLRMSSFLEVNLPPGQQSLASFFKPKDAGAGWLPRAKAVSDLSLMLWDAVSRKPSSPSC